MFEVELKFPVNSHDPIRQYLSELTTCSSGSVTQCDDYFNHSLLDFANQDIALRIRRRGDSRTLTFKGPNRDETAKIREEIEISLSPEDADRFASMLLGMGFHNVAAVEKRRETVVAEFQDRSVQICLDSVDKIGHFVELELVVDQEADIPAAKSVLQQLAQQLGITGQPTTTSYLEMLIRDGHV